jgi:protein SCO1/2
VQPVFITVDPARDTPEVMRAYVAAIHPRLIGLTGSEDEIRAVAKAYRVLRRKVRLGTGDPLDYTVDHSSLVYLLGPSGELLAQLSPTVDAAEMAELLRHYLAAAPAAAPPVAGNPSGTSDPR